MFKFSGVTRPFYFAEHTRRNPPDRSQVGIMPIPDRAGQSQDLFQRRPVHSSGDGKLDICHPVSGVA